MSEILSEEVVEGIETIWNQIQELKRYLRNTDMHDNDKDRMRVRIQLANSIENAILHIQPLLASHRAQAERLLALKRQVEALHSFAEAYQKYIEADTQQMFDHWLYYNGYGIDEQLEMYKNAHVAMLDVAQRAADQQPAEGE